MNTIRDRFETTLAGALQPWGIVLDDRQAEQLWLHYAAMVDANRTMNLTRIVEPEDAAIKHYADSCALIAWALERNLSPGKLLDLGTGPGFPSVPLAILKPDWSVTAIDGTRKKIDFVRSAADQIGLSNLRCIHAHSSHWDTPERFDLVTFRALAALPKAINEAARFLAPNGKIVAYAAKASDALSISDSRVEDPEAVCDAAGMTLIDRYEYKLNRSDTTIQRELLLIEPRRAAEKT